MKNNTHINGLHRNKLVKYLLGEANDREKTDVETWLGTSEENRVKLEQHRQLLEQTDLLYRAGKFPSDAAWSRVKSKINTPKIVDIQHKKLRKEAISAFYKYAAILILALFVAAGGYYLGFRNQGNTIYSEIITADKQVINDFVLPDGTTVTLNSGSKLIFPKQFEDAQREVTVEGEAFFDVKPHPDRPFVINAGQARVRVLGTSFNVLNNAKTNEVEVIVATGKVQVTAKNETRDENTQKEVMLLPGEKVTVQGPENRLEKSKNLDPNYLAWKTQDLIFDEMPLSDVVSCLEKVYHVDIQVSDPEINDLLLKAHFDKKPVDFVLNVIRLTFNLDLSGENGQFVLTSRNTNK